MTGARARRRIKKMPVQVEDPGPVTKDKQMAAACTISWYEASRLLGARQPGRMNEVPDRDYFSSVFDFTRADLLKYVKENDLGEVLYGKSLDQRCVPSVYIQETSGGYNVCWDDDKPQILCFHRSLDEAATDFVLRYWNRLPPE